MTDSRIPDWSERLLDLLERWSQARSEGRHLTPEDLAPDDPELQRQLQAEIAILTPFEKIESQIVLRAFDDSVEGGNTVDGPLNEPDQLSQTWSELLNMMEPAPTAEELGMVGKYRVIRMIGKGGMGVVFEGFDPTLERRVAIKIVRPASGILSEDSKRRFLREARTLARIKNERIITVHDVGEQKGLPYLVTELLQGCTLEARLADAPANLFLFQLVAVETTKGLRTIHNSGLIHRDIKPSNIWIEEPDNEMGASEFMRVKLLDFGLARPKNEQGLSNSRTSLSGTPPFMAPEPFRGLPLDARSDIFSLGAVFYWMATGQRPFEGRTLEELMNKLLNHTPPEPSQIRPDFPESFSKLIMQMLAKNPDDRPADAKEVLALLRTSSSNDGSSLTHTPLQMPAFPKETPRPEEPEEADATGYWLFGIAAVVLVLGLLIALRWLKVV
jgi:serine/threonine protein kinase